MQEKCYRHLQIQSGVGGVGLLEMLVLVAVPILLIPMFTLFDVNFLFIIIVEIGLFILFRFANKITPFAFGLTSYIGFHFLWPKKLSAFVLREFDYIVRKK